MRSFAELTTLQYLLYTRFHQNTRRFDKITGFGMEIMVFYDTVNDGNGGLSINYIFIGSQNRRQYWSVKLYLSNI